MADYLSLEEAAKKLGIKTDRLVELRSQGQVRGFRDGTSWKFPASEIDRLADDLADSLSGGSGVLVDDLEVGSSLSGFGSNIIGADEGVGSDLELGSETLAPGSGSDVNLIAVDGTDSDVTIVPSGKPAGKADAGSSGSDLKLMDDEDLRLEEPAILHDSGQLELAIEPKKGSTGPVQSGNAAKNDAASKAGDSDLLFVDEEDSGDLVLSADSGEVLGGDDLSLDLGGASSLELMSDLDASASQSGAMSKSSLGGDVLSELDLLSAEAGGSGLITGDSAQLLSGSSGLSGVGPLSGSGLDDALDDDDDLMIADDDDDLVISNTSGGDISIAGDSGINLMSPSDSGLSLESEPLDLAGSGLSALDLGAELDDIGGSGIGSGGGSGRLDTSGSAVDFDADEDFQLSPSGLGLEGDIESGSQVIEVEDSEAIGEPVEFASMDAGEADPFGGDVFGDAGGGAVVVDDAAMVDEESGFAVEETSTSTARPAAGMMAYEIPFTLMQVVGLAMILCTLGLGGMLMTDLVRNMWAYQELSSPVISLTDSLISVMGWDA